MKTKLNKTIERIFSINRNIKWNRKIKKKITPNISNYLNKKEIKIIKSYWKEYTNINLDFFNYYSYRTEIFSKFYIPDNIYYSKIDMYFNNRNMASVIDNKAFYDKIFPNLNHPSTPVKKINGVYYDTNYNLINFNELHKYLDGHEYLLKPSLDSQGGKGILFFNNTGGNIERKLTHVLSKEDNYLIQEVVEQHPDLSRIHPSSLNTIRVMSLFFKGKVYVLSSVLRMGVSGSKIDNASTGGIVVGIDEDGVLKKYAYRVSDYSRFEAHPDSEVIFEGYKLPFINEIKNIVETEAKKLPDFQLVSWDFAIDSNNKVVFIEANLKSGQLDFHQLTNGPLFGEMTDTVLTEVFNNISFVKLS